MEAVQGGVEGKIAIETERVEVPDWGPQYLDQALPETKTRLLAKLRNPETGRQDPATLFVWSDASPLEIDIYEFGSREDREPYFSFSWPMTINRELLEGVTKETVSRFGYLFVECLSWDAQGARTDEVVIVAPDFEDIDSFHKEYLTARPDEDITKHIPEDVSFLRINCADFALCITSDPNEVGCLISAKELLPDDPWVKQLVQKTLVPNTVVDLDQITADFTKIFQTKDIFSPKPIEK